MSSRGERVGDSIALVVMMVVADDTFQKSRGLSVLTVLVHLRPQFSMNRNVMPEKTYDHRSAAQHLAAPKAHPRSVAEHLPPGHS